VHAQLAGAETEPLQRFDAAFEDPRRRAAPAGVKQRGRSGWMRDENRVSRRCNILRKSSDARMRDE